ncbi:MAG: hypothetical protein KF774_21755 [Planctomyces sp.]|nr:hypothetical protein [Planctomyces sp.]
MTVPWRPGVRPCLGLRRSLRPVLWVTLAAILAIPAASASGHDASPAASDLPAPVENVEPEDAVQTEEAPPNEAARRRVSLALMIIAVLAGTGVALLLLTVLGGAATRRTLRRQPESSESTPLGRAIAEPHSEAEVPVDDAPQEPADSEKAAE